MLLLSFAGTNNLVLSEQFRINSRDLATASRMIARLEAEPGFPDAKKLAVVGRWREYPLHFLTTGKGDLNISGFGQWWSRANLIREVSGYRLAEPGPEDVVRAETYCHGAQPWPDPSSITVLDDIAVICLTSDPPTS